MQDFFGPNGILSQRLEDYEFRPSQVRMAEAVHRALDELSLAHREALTLHFLQDLSLEQIANVLEVPIGTVKSRLHHAKRELRKVLEREVSP